MSPNLSDRECQVLDLVCEGMSNVEIGKVLHITGPTVKSHLDNIFEKMGYRNRTHAAAVYTRHKYPKGYPRELIQIIDALHINAKKIKDREVFGSAKHFVREGEFNMIDRLVSRIREAQI